MRWLLYGFQVHKVTHLVIFRMVTKFANSQIYIFFGYCVNISKYLLSASFAFFLFNSLHQVLPLNIFLKVFWELLHNGLIYTFLNEFIFGLKNCETNKSPNIFINYSKFVNNMKLIFSIIWFTAEYLKHLNHLFIDRELIFVIKTNIKQETWLSFGFYRFLSNFINFLWVVGLAVLLNPDKIRKTCNLNI